MVNLGVLIKNLMEEGYSRENAENDLRGIQTRVSRTFSNKNYRNRIKKASSANWLQINIEEVFGQIESFLSELRSFDKV